jgi:hypothetical protein
VSPEQADDREPKIPVRPAQSDRVQLFRAVGVGISLQQRITVVGDDNIDVGNNPPRKPGQPIVKRSGERNGSTDVRIDRQNPLKTERPICGAMSQQYGDSDRGNESAPQKFVQLVGCRDPKARSEPWVRPLPSPAKR